MSTIAITTYGTCPLLEQRGFVDVVRAAGGGRI